jgi:hypothetical protein
LPPTFLQFVLLGLTDSLTPPIYTFPFFSLFFSINESQ